jgi:integrase
MSKVWKRKDRDTWCVDYRDAWGKRRRLTADTFGNPLATRNQAESLLADKIKEAKEPHAPSLEDPDVTLRDYVARWLDDASRELESATYRSYEQLLRVHILPEIGHLKVREIHRRNLKNLLRKKRQELKPGTKDHYGKNTIRLMGAAISTVLTDCVDDELIETNPALQIANRKKKNAGTISQAERLKKIRPMDQDQLLLFLEKAEDEPRFAGFFNLLAKAGLRPGEARALYPGDLDLRNQTVRVEKALSGTRLKSTKTEEVRDVDLSDELLYRLQSQLVRVKTEALQRGSGEPKWLFSNSAGQPLEDRKIGQAFHRILKKAKLPTFRVYDMRHTFASILLAEGAPITYVSQQLGHANPTTTLQFYAHWIPNKKKRFVNLLDSKSQPGDSDQEDVISADMETGTGETWHQNLAPSEGSEAGELQVIDSIGGPSRTRTCDPLIMSQLL